MKRVIFTILTAMVVAVTQTIPFAVAADRNAPPDGTTPTTATLSQILKAFHTASGTRTSVNGTTVEDWTYAQAGVSGTEHLVRAGIDYSAHITYGPLSESFGQFVGRAWHRDYNGVTTSTSGGDETSFAMLALTEQLQTVDDPKYDLKVAGEVGGAQPAYVVSVSKNTWVHPDWYFFDKQTGLIDKVIRVYNHSTTTLTYENYQTTLGLARPTHIHSTSGDSASDSDFVRTSFAVQNSVDPRAFAPPASTYDFAQYSGMMWLPTRAIHRLSFTSGGDGWTFTVVPTFVIPIMVNGRRLDFRLSSGSARSMIDSNVSAQLGLPTFGHATHGSSGDLRYETVLPEGKIGGLTLKNMALEALPFTYHPDSETQIVGIIGADLLSAGLFKFDMTNGSVLLMPPNSYAGHTPLKGAIDLPVDLDDGIAFTRGTISSNNTSNLMVDTNMPFSSVFGSFATSLPQWAPGIAKHKSTHTTAPFADSRGFGVALDIFPSAFDLQFGSMSFQNIGMVATNFPMSFGGRDVDAIIGADILRYYDLYLDYPHGHIYLNPNAEYARRFGAPQQGSR